MPAVPITRAVEDDNVLVKGIQQDPNALGYFGLAYYEANPTDLKALSIDSGKGPVLPTKSNVGKVSLSAACTSSLYLCEFKSSAG